MKSDYSFYSNLAERLRAVQARRSERALEENPAKRAAGGVGLDEVLNTLDSGALEDELKELQQRTKAQLEDGRRRYEVRDQPFGMPFDDQFLPQDPFEREVCRFFAERWASDVPLDLLPRAIVEALAKSTDHGGILDEQRVEQKLGARALDLLCEVKAELPKGAARARTTTPSPKQKHMELSEAARAKVALSRERRSFEERMPLLGEITRQLGGPGALRGLELESIQHLFPSTLGLYDALVDNGLVRAETGVGGKNYSSIADAVARMGAEGLDVHWMARPVPREAGLDSEKMLYEMAVSQLSRLFHDVDPRQETKRRFLLLDDGGKLTRALHERFPQYAHLCVAVEQTDRGIQVIEKMQAEGIELRIPVVNMARSWAKKDFEGPVIGESVAFHTEHELALVHPELKVEPKIACIIGYGAVGQATADALSRRGYQVVVYDKDPAAMERARADGHEALPREQALAKAHMLVGATGRTVLTPAEYDLLPDGAVLVNAASGNHELGLHDVEPGFFREADPEARESADGVIRTTFRGLDVKVGDGDEGEDILNRVIRTKSGKEVLALRAGYVVNMTLGLPPEYCQLTLGLLLSGCLQAAKETEPGIVDIPDDVQQFLVTRTKKHLASIGHDLAVPDFRSLPSWEA